MNLTGQQLEAYLLRNPQRAKRTLSIMGKNQQFINAMSSPMGKEFIDRLVKRVDVNRIEFQNLDIDASKEKFAEIRARLNESEALLYEFLDVAEQQEILLNEVKEAIKKEVL